MKHQLVSPKLPELCQGKKRSAETQIPDDFTNQVRKLMEQLDIPWDVAVYQIAQSIRK